MLDFVGENNSTPQNYNAFNPDLSPKKIINKQPPGRWLLYHLHPKNKKTPNMRVYKGRPFLDQAHL